MAHAREREAQAVSSSQSDHAKADEEMRGLLDEKHRLERQASALLADKSDLQSQCDKGTPRVKRGGGWKGGFCCCCQ